MALKYSCAAELVCRLIRVGDEFQPLGFALLGRGIYPAIFLCDENRKESREPARNINGPTASFLRELADALEMKETSNGA